MANRTFLIQSATAEPRTRVQAPSVALAAGSNYIPVYWYSIFDRSCLVTNQVTLRDGKLGKYEYLVASTSDALERCSQRRFVLEHFAPDSDILMPDKWMEFLHRVEMDFIHLDAAELWMMDPDTFAVHISNCLRAYEVQQPEQPIVGPFWEEMLDAAQIDPKNLKDSIHPTKLAGYSWGNIPVPWII